VQSECISFKNTELILEFSFAISGTRATMERVFSITYALQTDKKSCFLVETIKAVIGSKTHFEELLCNDFYTLISNNPKSLQEIRSFSQDICPRGKNNSFNINWKLTSNKILYVSMKKLMKI
jgi:hypothetical protein